MRRYHLACPLTVPIGRPRAATIFFQVIVELAIGAYTSIVAKLGDCKIEIVIVKRSHLVQGGFHKVANQQVIKNLEFNGHHKAVTWDFEGDTAFLVAIESHEVIATTHSKIEKGKFISHEIFFSKIVRDLG